MSNRAFHTNDEDRRRIIRIAQAIGIAILIALSYPYLLPGSDHKLTVSLILVGEGVAVGLVLLLASTGRLPASSLVLVFSSLLFINGIVVFSGDGIHDIIILAYSSALIVGGLLLNRRLYVLFSACVIASFAALTYAEIQGWYFSSLSSATEWQDMIDSTLILLVTAIAVGLLIDSLRQSVAKAESNAQELAASKMESLGTLAGGVAHDFNNLLQAIIGHAALAQRTLPADHQASGHLIKLEKAAARAAQLTQQLLAFTGRGKFNLVSIQLNDLLRENIHFLDVSIPKQIALVQDLDPGIPCLEGDPGQVQQIIMNLIINAKDAIGQNSGQIRISTKLETIGMTDSSMWLHSGVRPIPGKYIVLEVEDSGCGMSDETLNKIFDPFFTTKPSGRGLGLSAVQGILRAHHAALQVQSRLQVGTVFRIAFPPVPGEC